MGDSKIEWTEKTWNPVTGCSKVSQGCKNCYAERLWPNVYGRTGRKFTDVACHEDRLKQPLGWRKPQRVFVNSMSDLFHEDVPESFIDRVFAVMALCPQHQFQILTKRPERMRGYLSDPEMPKRAAKLSNDMEAPRWAPVMMKGAGVFPLPNVWLGVSVEDQATADARVPELLATPAAVRFVSAEPLLGAVDFGEWMPKGCNFSPWLDDVQEPSLDLVIVGGESGPKARPMHPDWPRSIRDQCQAAGVSFFFKQWGTWTPYIGPGAPRCNREWREQEGREKDNHGGRVLDGRVWDEMPGVGA